MSSSRSAERLICRPDVTPGRRPKLDGGRPALAELFEGHIIPQLIEDHDGTACLTQAAGLEREVTPFTDAILALDSLVSMDVFEDFVQRGIPVDQLFEHLLVPTALRLGIMWERDARDFLDVTRGMDHIQQIILAHSSDFCTDQEHADKQHRILLVSLPQERHRLGLCLVRADFWRAGWDVCCSELEFMNDLERLVKKARFDAVGISAGRVGDAPMLARSLDRVRRASSNPEILIVTGGHAFQRDPELSVAVGADFSAAGGREAVTKIQNRLSIQAALHKS